jgi:[acyl-carrier-protein] S-malonyltransferase
MLALLCSGQGRQHAEMFRLTAEAPAAAEIFAAATAVLSCDPRQLVLDAGPDALHANRTAQVLCVTQPLAAVAALDDALGARRLTAGYSVGELAAWGVAGALDAPAVPALAARRAELMDTAGEIGDGLAFARGLPEREVSRLAAETGVEPAIVNPNLVFVVGGAGAALDRFIAAARGAGAARADRLEVNTASHTPRLASAVEPFLDLLRATAPRRSRPGMTLLSALDGAALANPAVQADTLARQLATTLHWDLCLEAAFERGVTAVLELGPGRALADMAASLRPDLPVRSLDDFRSLDGVRAWLAAHS